MAHTVIPSQQIAEDLTTVMFAKKCYPFELRFIDDSVPARVALDRYDNERNNHKKRRLLIWPTLWLRELKRSKLHQVCRATRQCREQRASSYRSDMDSIR
jgi:hypothetical protein